MNMMHNCAECVPDETNPHCVECFTHKAADLVVYKRRLESFQTELGNTKIHPCNGCPDWDTGSCEECTHV